MPRKSENDFGLSATIDRLSAKEKRLSGMAKSGSSDGGGIARTAERIGKLIQKVQERRAAKKGQAVSGELAINILNMTESDKAKINAEIMKLERHLKAEKLQIAKDQASIQKLKALL